jgi:hypothetical protein
MKIFLLIIMFSFSLLASEEVDSNETVFFKTLQGSIKVEHYKKVNHIKLEASASAFLENDYAWGDGKVKCCICDVDKSKKAVEVDLERLLIGHHLYVKDDTDLFLEVGRSKMDYLFTSRLQFRSYFNGIHLSLKKGDLRIHAGENIIDSKLNHYGTIAEIWYQNILGFPLMLSYSLTDWLSEQDYINSQLSAMWNVTNVYGQPVAVYAAVLKNHMERAHSNGFYIGTCIGCIEKAKDWLIDVTYHYTGDYLIPDFDDRDVGDGIEIKSAISLTDHFFMQGKFEFSWDNYMELSANYKW